MKQTDSMNRRWFLALSGGLVAGAGVFGELALGAEPGKKRKAGKKGKGGGAGKLLVTVRDVHLRDVGEKDVWSALRAIKSQGLEIQVDADLSCPNLFGTETRYSVANEDGAKRIAENADRNGFRVTSFLMHNQFDTRGAEEVKMVAAVGRAGRIVGATAIRLDVVPRKIKDKDEFVKFAIGIMKDTVKATEDSGLKLAIENHGGTTNQVDVLERLFDGVGSDRLGLTLDAGNFYWFGYPLDKLYEIYTKFAPRAFHTHCKSIKYPEDQRNVQRQMGWEYDKFNCPVYDGDIDFKRVAAILKAANYRGDLCIEDESLGKFKGKQGEVLAKEVAFLKELA